MPTEPSQPSPLDVIVVDDDPHGRAAVARAVRSLGHTCREAADGGEALELVGRARPDVVISDMQMPKLDGAELCKRIRALEDEGPYTYFILVTGYGDREHLFRGMEAGADDYQQKPIDLDELEARLFSARRVVALHRRIAERSAELRRDSRRLWIDSRTDALTHVGNRLAFEEETASVIARAARYGRPTSLAMCDVDLFKTYNDQFGHVAGDDALAKIALAIRAHVRTTDGVYRYGGEEFAVVLPEQGVTVATLAMERVVHEVEKLGIPSDGGPLTMSVGVAELTNPGWSREQWVGAADAALYEAKRGGRNRVVAASPEGRER